MLQKIKNVVQFLIQRVLGYRNYLYCFSIYRILRYQFLKDDNDLGFFIRLVNKQKQGIIIDAGANVGYTSIIFAKAFPYSSIIAYEPVRLLSSIIADVVRFFGVTNVDIRQKALGNTSEKVLIKTPIIQGVKKQGLSFIDKELDREDAHIISNSIDEEVNMVSLDSEWINEADITIAGIKVDVENFEYFVLNGAEKIIREFQPVVMAELWDNNRKKSCIHFMENIGYDVYVIQHKELVKYKDQASLNYFFIPSNRIQEK